MTTEERLSRLEGAYEQVDQRLGDLAHAVMAARQEMIERYDALHREVNEGHTALRQEMADQIGGLRTEMNSRFNNLYLFAGGAWVTTVGLIIGLYLQS